MIRLRRAAEFTPEGAAMTAGRRKLAFATLDEVMPDVERLLAGHATVGRWSLGQILNHLALTVCFPIDGVPEKCPWLMRRLLGPVSRRVTFWLGRFPEGVRVPDCFLPLPGPDPACEAEALRAAIERFAAFTAPPDEHPLFGPLSLARWERFHRLHCAHHLSFAVPLDRRSE